MKQAPTTRNGSTIAEIVEPLSFTKPGSILEPSHGALEALHGLSPTADTVEHRQDDCICFADKLRLPLPAFRGWSSIYFGDRL